MKSAQFAWIISDNQKNFNEHHAGMDFMKDVSINGLQTEFIEHSTRGILVINKANKLI